MQLGKLEGFQADQGVASKTPPTRPQFDQTVRTSAQNQNVATSCATAEQNGQLDELWRSLALKPIAKAAPFAKWRKVRNDKPRREAPARLRHRRRLAASGPMPPALAARFTVGELSALRIVADEVAATGFCDLTLGELGDRAQVGRTTVQNAMRHAAGLLTVREQRRRGCRSGPNIVTIISPEWLLWLRMGTFSKRARSVGASAQGSRTRTPQTRENNILAAAHERAAAQPPVKWRGSGQAEQTRRCRGGGAILAAIIPPMAV
ncbi:MAG: hypothetical protein WDM84_07960 [Bauldia sp.]